MLGRFTSLSEHGKRIVRNAFPGFRGRTFYAEVATENDQGKCRERVHNWWDEGYREYPCVVQSATLRHVKPPENHPGFSDNPAEVEFDGRDVLVLHVYSGTRKYIRIVATEAVLSDIGTWAKI